MPWDLQIGFARKAEKKFASWTPNEDWLATLRIVKKHKEKKIAELRQDQATDKEILEAELWIVKRKEDVMRITGDPEASNKSKERIKGSFSKKRNEILGRAQARKQEDKGTEELEVSAPKDSKTT